MNAPSEDASPLSDDGTSIDDAVVQSIVESALRAPSAENTQPWLLKWHDQQLEVRHDRSKKMASDIGSMLDFTGLGALIESLVLASSTHGLSARVETLPAEGDSDQSSSVVAILTFRKSTDAPHPLAAFLPTRCTTRRMDPRRQVELDTRLAIEEAACSVPGIQISWIRNEDIRLVADLIGLGNRLRFEHRDFHQELYDNLRFTKAEAERTRDGLDVATLQLPWGVAGVMQLLRKWPIAHAANVLGFSRAVGRQAAAEVRQSGAIGVLSTQGVDHNAFVSGGRALQRAWLEATRRGIAFHPTASLPVFIAVAERADETKLPRRIQVLAQYMARTFRSIYSELVGTTPQMLFRIGYGSPPKVRTVRREFGNS